MSRSRILYANITSTLVEVMWPWSRSVLGTVMLLWAQVVCVNYIQGFLISPTSQAPLVLE